MTYLTTFSETKRCSRNFEGSEIGGNLKGQDLVNIDDMVRHPNPSSIIFVELERCVQPGIVMMENDDSPILDVSCGSLCSIYPAIVQLVLKLIVLFF